MDCCTRVAEPWDPDAYYAIRPECKDDVPKTHFKPRTGRTLSTRRWHALFSEDGHLDIATGVHPTVKGEVWEFLLGCYDPDSTFDARTQLRQQRRSEYNALKSKCMEMEQTVGSGRLVTTPVITEDGQSAEDLSSVSPKYNMQSNQCKKDEVIMDKEVIQWKLTLHQIGLDVVRTDRALVYYESQENQARLWDILAVYSWVDKDIGYCQGMSDLCSPISILVENEADAFWCFERLMRRIVCLFFPPILAPL
ncbi:TBC1 domain family member 15-like isoform X2 [Asparagus officinalis]|uniref:TBC1 domain family member 15-like isoform X2 n=1 Tax=Asparagus officinalis TaxID=4686 RepID=UPI00098E23A7|nr:TBC1 domain family member 15-like isoform X2 [Asparagus officinalis]